MLTVLRQIIQEVAGTQNFRDALNVMVKQVAKALNSEACSVFLLDERKQNYVLAATQGLNQGAVGNACVPFGKGLVGLIADREEALNIDDARAHPKFLQLSEIREEPFRALLGAPLIYHRQVLGVIMVQQREPRRYDESEEAFLVTIATQLAAIIAHAEAVGDLAELFSLNTTQTDHITIKGVPGSPGIALGRGVVIYAGRDLENVLDRHIDDISGEIQSLSDAFESARSELRELSAKLAPHLPPEEKLLFDAYQKILDNDELEKEIADEIKHTNNWAPGALRVVINTHAHHLESVENDYIRERADDIRDLGRRVLSFLLRDERSKPEYVENTILIGEELTANHLAEVPEGYLAGVISTRGSSNSHIAILARALNVPTVMGAADLPTFELKGQEIIIDGYYGEIYLSPNPSVRNEFVRLIQEEKKMDAKLATIRKEPAMTKDHHRVSLLVNTGLGADFGISLAAGAEGVGLYRTEIPFLMRDRFPSGEEQRVIYRQLLSAFSPLPVVVRTLDIGGDKPLPYFPIQEDNPFLGWRGIRMMLDHPEIFLLQVRALLRASEGLDNLRIMLPMITEVAEVDEAMRLIRKAHQDVLDEGLSVNMPPIGVMIEVPSAVYQARALAKRVDFLSVGSNDLTQYILAVDRNNSRVANLYDAMHPAVLRALTQIVSAGHQEGKHVSICGELAGDPSAVMILLGMGFDSFSMNASSIGKIKWVVRHVHYKRALKLLHEVLNLESASLVRCRAELELERMGLAYLIRAGR